MAGILELGLSNGVMAIVLATVAAVLSRLYRRPAFAFGLWLLVLVKLVSPSFVAIPFPWLALAEDTEPIVELPLVVLAPEEKNQDAFMPSSAVPTDTPALPVSAGENTRAAHLLPASWYWPIVLVWITGSLWFLARIVSSVCRFQRLLRCAEPAHASIQEMVKELAARLKLHRHPEVWLVPGTISPMLWAFGQGPRLLFPDLLLERLDRDQLRTILLHELAHWRRRDHFVRLLEVVVSVLYWWHPVVWWARAELHEAEEQCCDAWVLAVLDGADRTYATALLETVAFLSKTRLPLPTLASGIGQVSHLRRRLTMINERTETQFLDLDRRDRTRGLCLVALASLAGSRPASERASK